MKYLNVKAILFIITSVSLVLLLIINYIQGVETIDFFTMAKQVPVIVTINSVIIAIFIKWLWRIPWLPSFLVPFPDLNGTWQGQLKSDWIAPDGKKVKPIPIFLTVKQSFFTISCVIRTGESTSYSFNEGFLIDNEKQIKQLCYSYKNEPEINVQSRSNTHSGTALLDIKGNKKKMHLEGKYWTDRKTTGLISVEFESPIIIDKLPDDTPKHPVKGKFLK